MASSTSALAEARLIGREQELKELEALLECAPAVVTVAAQPGMGKSAVVKAFSELCRAKGWTVMGPSPGEAPLVGSRTTKEQFLARIGQLLNSIDTAGRVSTSSSSLASASAMPRNERRLLAQVVALARLAPAVLIIEDFDADLRFAGWFDRGFLTDVTGCKRHVIVLLTGQPADLAHLEHVDAAVTLGPLDESAVRARFEQIGSRLRPRPEPKELAEYVRKASKSPSLMTSLAVVLALAEA